MKVRGAGGFYEERIYELATDAAWQITQIVVDYMGVKVDTLDPEIHLIQGEYNKKFFQVHVEELDSQTCKVKVDCRKKVIQVYNWKPGDEEVNEFYEGFDKKMKEFRAYILCPNCRTRIEANARFCPQCGTHLK